MDPLTISAIIGLGAAAAPVLGDIIGQLMGSGDREAADRLMQQAAAEWDIPIPELQQLMPQLGPSQAAEAQADPVAVQAQRQALQELQRIGNQGADNIEYRAAMDRASRDSAREANARTATVQQDMAARGLGNSGFSFANQAVAGQAAADRASARGFDAAAEGRRQALQALASGGALAGQMRGQSFGEATTRGRAADEIAKFNEMGRAGAYQDRFNMQARLAGGKAGVAQDRANIKTGQAARTQQQGANYGTGIGQAIGTVGQSYLEDEARKSRGGYG